MATYGRNQFVAVGDSGTIVTSADGTNWAVQASNTSQALYGVTITDNGFLAVGQSGTILISSNAIDWRSVPSPTTNTLGPIVFASGKTVALGRYGTVMTCTNGIDWVSFNSPSLTNLHFTSVCAGNGKFVATAMVHLQDYSRSLVSSNGMDWIITQTNYPALNSVAFGAGKFTAVGYFGRIFTSTDGIAWQTQSPGTNASFWGVAYGNGKFVAVTSNSGIVSSPDGVVWTHNPIPGVPSGGISWCNNTFVAVGAKGSISTSTDGLTWQTRSTGDTPTLYGIAHGSGRLVAVGTYPSGSGITLISTNGTVWGKVRTNATDALTDVIYQNGQYTAVGSSGTILSSSDGLSWTRQTSGTSRSLLSVAGGNGARVAVGYSGTAVVSTNGGAWTSYQVLTNRDFRSVAFGNGLFVALADGGTNRSYYTTVDGVVWSKEIDPPFNGSFLMFGNGLFLSKCSTNGVWTSTNAKAWTLVGTIPLTPAHATLRRGIYANGNYLVAGSYSAILSSEDGKVWVDRLRPALGVSVHAFAFTNGTFFAVGDNGMVLQSGDVRVARIKTSDLSTNGFNVTLTGETGKSYRLQAATALTNWLDVAFFTLQSATTNLVDASALSHPQKFYRIISP